MINALEKFSYPTLKSRPLTLIHEIPILRTEKYWNKLGRGEIYATKCIRCNTIYYPPQIDCISCLTSQHMKWIKLSNEGIIETFTQVHLKPQGFTNCEYNYIIGIARVPEGVKVMGWFLNTNVKDVYIGMHVKILGKITSDNFHLIIFEPYKGKPLNKK